MDLIRSSLLAITLVLLLFWQAQAQQLKFVQGTILASNGNPIANQTLFIEGSKERRWFDFLLSDSEEKIKAIAMTDDKGHFQVVDLPPGEYTVKLVRPGKEPVSVKEFKLERRYLSKDVTATLPLKESVQLKESLTVEKR